MQLSASYSRRDGGPIINPPLQRTHRDARLLEPRLCGAGDLHRVGSIPVDADSDRVGWDVGAIRGINDVLPRQPQRSRRHEIWIPRPLRRLVISPPGAEYSKSMKASSTSLTPCLSTAGATRLLSRRGGRL